MTLFRVKYDACFCNARIEYLLLMAKERLENGSLQFTFLSQVSSAVDFFSGVNLVI